MTIKVSGLLGSNKKYRIRRVYHPYDEWEDYIAGMWRATTKQEEAGMLKAAIEFVSDAELYGKYMLVAVDEWPIAMEHNLTADGVNKRAFVGQCACCIAINCPEHITRMAWRELTQDQRNAANEKADESIRHWLEKYVTEKNICPQK